MEIVLLISSWLGVLRFGKLQAGVVGNGTEVEFGLPVVVDGSAVVVGGSVGLRRGTFLVNLPLVFPRGLYRATK